VFVAYIFCNLGSYYTSVFSFLQQVILF